MLAIAANRARASATPTKTYDWPIKPPKLMQGVVPDGVTAPVLAMDTNPYAFAADAFPGGGFPGFAYLSQLATRPEYRAFASALSTELTREWIEFTSKQDDATDTAEKIKAIEEEFKRLNIRSVIQRAAEQDSYFGRAQIFLDVEGADRSTPLILDPRTVRPGSLSRVVPVEAIWTTPAGYNALDPVAPDFYKPSKWFMLGQEVHASRLMTIVTRPLPDILKPAFNFAGMSLSQLAEPYVDNWLRTRQSVSDLINNFSTTALATAMDQILQGDDDGADLLNRADLFTATRSNKGLMLLDKEREELIQINTPLSGLHELQAQSQEHMCSVSRMPAIVLTGISPSGLNASSDGEIRIFYDWIAAQQEAFWREPLEVILKAVQLSLFGEIDPDIGLSFVPLYQMTPAEEADIRAKDGQTDCAYVAAGIIDPSEVRDRLAKDPNSGYQGLDTSIEIVPPTEPDPGAAMDAEFKENEHPRAANGQFGSGGGGGAQKAETVAEGPLTDEEKARFSQLQGLGKKSDSEQQEYARLLGRIVKNRASAASVSSQKPKVSETVVSKKDASEILSGEKPIPDGWYVHGRSRASELSDAWAIQMTRSMDVAEGYAGEKGSVHMVRPTSGTKVADFGNESSPDLDKLLGNLKKQFAAQKKSESGPIFEVVKSIATRNDIPVSKVKFEDFSKDVRSSLTPKNIVDSAEGYDSDVYLNLLEYFGSPTGKAWPDFVKTPDGAVVLPGAKNNVDSVNLTEAAR